VLGDSRKFGDNMLIHSASQLLTLAGGPQRGKTLGTLGIIENGAVVIRDEKIIAVGTTDELKNAYPDEPTLDASRCVLMPGFVDPHTHLIWAGDRANEFEMKMGGMAYLDILAAGGGILSTVKATRTASMETLIANSSTFVAHVRAWYHNRRSKDRLWIANFHRVTLIKGLVGIG
jgi:imidazolonepropionase